MQSYYAQLNLLSPSAEVRPSSDKSDFRRPPTLGGYALMNQNTTIEATETKMDHVSVISIKKGPFEPNLPILGAAPLC